MLIKITESCSMGCSHCMNDAKPCDRHMTLETANSVMDFIITNDMCHHMLITGGEPTEHPQFMDVMKTIINRLNESKRKMIITITTNGVWCETHYDEVKELLDMNSSNLFISFQVSNDSRYYPKRLDLNNPVFKLDKMVMCIDEDCVQQIYPQGRARNFKDWNAKCSKCFNTRSVTKQLFVKQSDVTNIQYPLLKDVIGYLESHNKFCTPAIHYDGGIGLGESDLCPCVATIFDDNVTISKNILKFDCYSCDFINEQLPSSTHAFIRPMGYHYNYSTYTTKCLNESSKG